VSAEAHKIKLLRWAEAHERRGNLETAVKGYIEAEAFEQAARVCISLGRFVEAAQWLLRSIGYNPRRTIELDARQRKIAIKAANYLVLGEELKPAIEILVNIGERERAVELLRKSGQDLRVVDPDNEFAEAPPTFSGVTPAQKAQRAVLAEEARTVQQGGDHTAAGRLFAQANKPFEAAVCFLAAGDERKALAHLVRVPRDHARYREACLLAIRAGRRVGELVFQFELFIGDFLATGPLEPRELEAFYALGALCDQHGLPVLAADSYRKLLIKDASFRDVAARLEAIESRLRRPASSPPVASPLSTPTRTVLYASAPPAPPAQPPITRPTPSSVVLPDDASLSGNTMVNGRYELTRLIGRGGMSLVYEARDSELDETIAIKFFSAAWADDAALARFKQEVSLSRRFNHRNVIRLYDLGVHGEYRYITMELLTGDSLRNLMHGGAINFWTRLDLLIQACNGLQCVHDQGVIHRDIKPENFFVTDDGTLKVTDFGIAKRRSAGRAITMAGMMAGTPQYMAPEQINNFGAVTHLADLYSLGCIAYELFTGTLPFDHEEMVALLTMHMNQVPEPPRARSRDVPADLEAVIMRLLDKDPAQRFQSCRALAAALANIQIVARERDGAD
jgi:serine/threonine-protein kinase